MCQTIVIDVPGRPEHAKPGPLSGPSYVLSYSLMPYPS